MAHLRGIGTAVVVVVCSSFSTAATLTVDLNGGADYTDIQAAIDAAADGDTVLVKPGEYVITEPINFNRLHNPDNPLSPPVKNIVVKSAGGAGVTTIRMAETPADPNRASVVIFESGEHDTSALDDFKITGGKGTKYGTVDWEVGGGGILCMKSSSPTLKISTISGNWTFGNGGGVCCGDGSSPTLTNCTISGNSAIDYHGDGGGLYFEDSSSILTNCTISGNIARNRWMGGEGGGVRCRNSSLTFTSCRISSNWASFGGGVADSDSMLTLTSCTISENFAGGPGGGVAIFESSPALTNCIISGNSAYGGGGVSCYSSSPTLTNCTITGNWGFLPSKGGGIYCYADSYPLLTNCTITENMAPEGGGVYCEDSSSPMLKSCIVWGNTPESVCGTISHCPTDQDPLLVQPGHWEDCVAAGQPGCIVYQWNPDTGEETAWHRWIPGDYHLQLGSPAIDAGTSEGAPTTDIEGRIRPCGAGVDIGAYESGNCWPTPAFIRGDSNADGTTDITDAIVILSYKFLGEQKLPCEQAGDANDDGALDVSDAVYTLSFLFTGGAAIESPVGTCGVDPTGHQLPCAGFPACQ